MLDPSFYFDSRHSQLHKTLKKTLQKMLTENTLNPSIICKFFFKVFLELTVHSACCDKLGDDQWLGDKFVNNSVG